MSIIILGGFLLVLFWLASVRLNDFYESQESVAKETTDIVHLEIERQLAHKRLLVQIFLEDNYKNISYLAMNPHEEEIFKGLNAKLERFFPDYFSVNIIQKFLRLWFFWHRIKHQNATPHKILPALAGSKQDNRLPLRFQRAPGRFVLVIQSR